MPVEKISRLKKRVLLIGPPNVGKSVFFNLLTGLDVGMANYAGTTVDYMVGSFVLDEKELSLIDVPGTYTLDATNKAEEVAIEILKEKPELVICVLDASNLESGLYLLLQLLKQEIPVIVALNRIDLLVEKGYTIDVDLLSQLLQIPVIPTVAVQGEGLTEIKEIMKDIINEQREFKSSELEATWENAENLINKATKKPKLKNKVKREKWGELLVQPWPGLPLTLIILTFIFSLVIGLGMGLRQYILLPVFRNLIFPQIVTLVEAIVPAGVFQNILIGEYGFLIKGLEWPLALVLPYIISFYLGFSLLEDSGYLPRLGILLDGLFNKVGLAGGNIIPLLLGYGCAIPGITATRALNSSKERIIVSTMICLSIPCVAQTGAFISLLAEGSILVVLALFIFSILVLILSAFIMNKFIKGEKLETVMEIPELLWPRGKVILKKVWIRLKSYLLHGAVTMIYAIALAAFLYEIGVFQVLGRLMEPLVATWLRLPEEAAVPLVLGIVRRELTVLPLLDMNLTSLQLFVGAVVGLFYVPCIAVLAILNREFNLKTAVGVLLFTTITSFLLGGIIARIGEIFTGVYHFSSIIISLGIIIFIFTYYKRIKKKSSI